MKLKDETLDLILEYGITRVRAMRICLRTRNLAKIERSLDGWKERSHRINHDICLYGSPAIISKKLYDKLGNYYSGLY